MLLALLTKIFISLLVLSVLIFIHELGHFLFAKMCKVTVLEFAIGFGKIIWQKRIGTTRYSLRLIPLGGFVRMAGDDYNYYYQEEEEKTEEAPLTLQPIDEDVDPEIVNDKRGWFLEKSLLARSSIVFAGPLFNFLLAYFLLVFLYLSYGMFDYTNRAEIGEFTQGFPAEKSGLLIGDKIKAINGINISKFEELLPIVGKSNGEEINLLVERKSGKSVNVKIKPELESEERTLFRKLQGQKNVKANYKIGIGPPKENIDVSVKTALYKGLESTWRTSVLTLKSIAYLITGDISPKHIGGPITIMGEVAKSTENGIEGIFSITIFISISLAILNLLPIPVLDGGHLLLFTLEFFNRGRLNRKFMDYANQLGIFLLLSLMVFAIGNDLFKLVAN